MSYSSEVQGSISHKALSCLGLPRTKYSLVMAFLHFVLPVLVSLKSIWLIYVQTQVMFIRLINIRSLYPEYEGPVRIMQSPIEMKKFFGEIIGHKEKNSFLVKSPKALISTEEIALKRYLTLKLPVNDIY